MLVALSPDDLDPDFAEILQTQRYAPGPSIEGVVVHTLREHVDESGTLVELGRFSEVGELLDLPGFVPRQLNWSRVEPGAVKAWHLHLHQDDVWFVPPQGRLLAGLSDTRADSPTHGVLMRLVLGAGRAQLVRVPRGVAHGVANLWTTGSDLIYLVDQTFDPTAPDEHRLPWDAFGEEFWALRRG